MNRLMQQIAPFILRTGIRRVSRWIALESPNSIPVPATVVPTAVIKLNAATTLPRIRPLLSRTYTPRYRRMYCTSNGQKHTDPSRSSRPDSSDFSIHSTNKTSPNSTSRNRTVAFYTLAAIIATGGLSYAAVPLYKMYCSATGYAGTTKVADASVKPDIVYGHPLTIKFTSQVSDTLPWTFHPVQREMVVLPGQKALAFYEATNHSTEPLVGVATYNVVPDSTGAYFNKIQCFCFDEQRLNPGETVHMPIHFFVDPEFLKEKTLRGLHEITLSYTFFLADDQSSEWWEEERDKHARPTS